MVSLRAFPDKSNGKMAKPSFFDGYGSISAFLDVVTERAQLAATWHQPAVAASTLEDFTAGKTDLNLEVLKALTKLFHPNAEYDAQLDLLRSLTPPPRSMGITPPAYDPEKHSPYHPPPVGPWIRGGGIKSVSPSPPAAPLTRPGWAR